MEKACGIYCFAQKEVLLVQCPEGNMFARDDMVIFHDKDKKEEAGKIVFLERAIEEKDAVNMGGSILRKMTPRDTQVVETNLRRGESILAPARKSIGKHGLDMQLFDAAYSFDGARINFIFTADDRVDFRELVKDLAKQFQKQIHLKQIGPRDKAKILGGFGRCGRTFCCNLFMSGMESITMDMVRDQGLASKGSSKLSGGCGKLLCCLKFEVEEYKNLMKNLPPFHSIVKLKTGTGKVIGIDVLNQKVKLVLDDGGIRVHDIADIKSVVSKPVDGSREEPREAQEEPEEVLLTE